MVHVDTYLPPGAVGDGDRGVDPEPQELPDIPCDGMRAEDEQICSDTLLIVFLSVFRVRRLHDDCTFTCWIMP